MTGLLLRRLAQGVVIVWGVVTITFLLLHLAPGDPITMSLNNALIPPEVRTYWQHVYGLDRPIAEQYWRYLANVVHGDFGFSFPHRRAVGAVIADALPNTLILMGTALLLAFSIGMAVGIIQARQRGRALDWGLSLGSLLFYSLPDFWFALIMLFLFAYVLRLFPVMGMVDSVMYPYLRGWERIADRLWHLTLPATTLALLSAAAIARYQRAAVLEVSAQDFIRTARAKGLSEYRIVLQHILRNALLPIITLLGLSFPALLGGAVFVEKIFSWPGMGTLTYEAIAARDYPLLTAAVIIASVMVTIGNLIADFLYALADPRVRYR